MMLQIVISLFGLAEAFLPYMVNMLVVVWFFSVGYLLWKRLNPRVRAPKTEDAPAGLVVLQN